ncbi:hypothetical protein OS493_012550 [Desmophyllum pertusum]|uniref:Uncharacterized protein n=1 Tax=Desmophyllum pertusum TaxID=174260 RepID=A0A9W9ZDP0_9CNID|nr:hypothetical protein OS493_012550 [Desmophyllum pertusum]
MQHRPEMPSFKKRTEAPRDQRHSSAPWRKRSKGAITKGVKVVVGGRDGRGGQGWGRGGQWRWPKEVVERGGKGGVRGNQRGNPFGGDGNQGTV